MQPPALAPAVWSRVRQWVSGASITAKDAIEARFARQRTSDPSRFSEAATDIEVFRSRYKIMI